MTVTRASVVVQSTNRQGALDRYKGLLGAPPLNEFPIPGADLVVTVFAGLSVLSGSAEALAPVRDLHATVFVESLKEVEELLIETGWAREGSLGATGSLLARDTDGNLLEFVEEPALELGGRPSRSAPSSNRAR
jgi:hypothetical protein